jgi:hypothetical protein
MYLNGAELKLKQAESPKELLILDQNVESGNSHLRNLENLQELFAIKGYIPLLYKKVKDVDREEINTDQLLMALNLTGFDYNYERAEDFISEFDLDNQKKMGFNEFSVLFSNLAREVKLRIQNLAGQLIMTLEEDTPPSPEKRYVYVYVYILMY